MGAEIFEHKSKGKDVQEAFNNACSEALWDHGHSGYTGTIAEKSGFQLFEVPNDWGENIYTLIDQLYRGEGIDAFNYPEVKNINRMQEIYNDKWGDCVAFDLGDGEFLFVGWASS